MLATPVHDIINMDVNAYNKAAAAITPCVTENTPNLFPEDSNDEREEKAKTYIKHMLEYAFMAGVLQMPSLEKPFSGNGCWYFEKSPLKSPPAPRLKIDKTIPSLVDTSIGKNWINMSMNHYTSIFGLFHEIISECYRYIAREEELPLDQINSSQPHKGELYKKHETEILKIIVSCLDFVFPMKKDSIWKDTTANLFHIQLTSSDDSILVPLQFVSEHMKPYIHRNFCTMLPEEIENERTWDSVVTVPTMYSILYTFLQGSKRKQSSNFHIGSDLTRKIFDHLNIRTKDGLKWSSFQHQLQA
jgi:hypothetical protein